VAEDLIARHLQAGPVEEVGAEQAQLPLVLLVGRPWRRIGDAARLPDDRHHEHQRADPVGMAQCHLQCGGCARRDTHYRGLVDPQCIEQPHLGIGLRLGRGIGRPRRAQVSEARHRDHAHTVPRQ